MEEDIFVRYRKLRLRYDVSYRGMAMQKGGKKRPTWRIELMEQDNSATDIWSECWMLEDGTWTGSYQNRVSSTLVEALMNCLQSLLEYSGLDEVEP
jgi:hypothetical protein